MILPDKHQTIVLLFAQSSEKEAMTKRIAFGEALFDVLTEQTIGTIQKSGLPYVHMDENSQIGNSFGERFTNAIQDLFDQGYERIITIGNDSPELRPSHLQKANKALNDGEFVLGRTSDGGFYLMGLQKAHFDQMAFKRLSWQTPKVSNELMLLVSENHGNPFQLEFLLDIDTSLDVRRCLNRAKKLSSSLLGIIAFILGIVSTTDYYLPTGWLRYTTGVLHNKGSPYWA